MYLALGNKLLQIVKFYLLGLTVYERDDDFEIMKLELWKISSTEAPLTSSHRPICASILIRM
jgi:hypothetical protein